jgi:Tol biopolymer transport system component
VENRFVRWPRLAAGCTAAFFLALASSASADSFPGSNGQIAFVDETLVTFGIDLTPPDFLAPAPITGSDDEYPSWSADGRKIVFDRAYDPRPTAGPRDVWVMNADGTCPRQVTSTSADEWSPSFSPSSKQVAYTRDGGIWISDIDGGGAHPLVSSATHPAWSPDGNWIAYDTPAMKIRRVHPDGTGGRTVLSASNVYAPELPNWSPDGSRLLVDGQDPSRPPYAATQIWSVRPDGTGVTQLTHFPDVPPTDPDYAWSGDAEWSPNGANILFELQDFTGSGGSFRYSVMEMQPDGSELRRIIPDAGDPAWQPAGVPPDSTPDTCSL